MRTEHDIISVLTMVAFGTCVDVNAVECCTVQELDVDMEECSCLYSRITAIPNGPVLVLEKEEKSEWMVLR